MKLKFKKILFYVFICLLILFTYHYLINYFIPEPDTKITDWKRIDISSYPELFNVCEIEEPIEEIISIEFFQENPRSDIFSAKENFEFIVHTGKNFQLPSYPLMDKSKLIDYKLNFNGNDLDLNVKEKETCNNVDSLKKAIKGQSCYQTVQLVENGKKEAFSDCKISDYYFLPPLELEGNGRANKLDLEYKFIRTFKNNAPLKIPIFLKENTYVQYIFLPPPPKKVFISEKYDASIYTTFTLNKKDYYHIVKQNSGWVSWYIGFIDNLDNQGSVMFKPIENQETTLKEEIFSSKLVMKKDNSLNNFMILLIPNLKIFLLPLIFLWFPIIYNQFIKRKFWKQILILYIILFGILGIINFDGLESFSIVYYSFYFFKIGFIVLIYFFPFIYSFLVYKNNYSF